MSGWEQWSAAFHNIDEWWSHLCGTAWTAPLGRHTYESHISTKWAKESCLILNDRLCVSTCKPNFLITQQAKDAVVKLHVSAMVLVHFSEYSHELCTSLSGVGALTLMCWQLMKRTLPRAANPLVLALCHPDNIMATLCQKQPTGKRKQPHLN